ncbi:TetR/AcrR family transcriptional regulator [Enterococcus rivorum]|uniref:AcrR family transcriptional regulator n=1 Tax=Enterococcus rivorum TaxID=762845 RepID=A0A1E5KVB9_9ENTE|nr:TetR/AcrR family transcriptional regulator [Enterococcus rivorum]MBP2098390.1 AcrR family transcriptional regulator [Enterococcus rivorum]OEH81826.1 AcrR family transcriptional regulator [Enterococcus rivorum]
MDMKDRIYEGLLSVMKIDDYSLITVTQISQEAAIGRKTFYRYFKSKEEVLKKYIEKLMTEYKALVRNYFSIDMGELIENYFAFWMRHRSFLELMYRHKLMFYMYEQYEEFVPLINEQYIELKKLDSITSKYVNAYVAGTFWSILYAWIKGGGKETPRELAAICLNMTGLTMGPEN